jgi:hypothetical protein
MFIDKKRYYVAAIVVIGLMACNRAQDPRRSEPSTASVAKVDMPPASTAPMLALLTKADWCSVCKANGGRVTEVLAKGVAQGNYELVVLDITDDQTTAAGQKVVDEKGLTEVASGNAPGTIVFIDQQPEGGLLR